MMNLIKSETLQNQDKMEIVVTDENDELLNSANLSDAVLKVLR